MQFRILGTERDTGQGVAKTITALTEDDARAKAQAMNVEIMDIHYLGDGGGRHTYSHPVAGATSWNPGVAAVMSLVIPGAGQMYKGRIGPGFGWLVIVPLGYLVLFIPGIILHVLCVFDAYSGKPDK